MRSIVVLTLLLSAGLCKKPHNHSDTTLLLEEFSWDETKAGQYLKAFTSEPHPLGSPRQLELAKYLQGQVSTLGLELSGDRVTVQVPDPSLISSTPSVMQTLSIERSIENVMGKVNVPGSNCVILLGSHYDSKRLEGSSSVGANDSGSSSVALLEIMRNLQNPSIKSLLGCSVMAIWLDAEEAFLKDWHDGETKHPLRAADHLYGSRHFAKQLQTCGRSTCLPEKWGGEAIKAFILLDMVGMPKLKLTADTLSDPTLLNLAQAWDQSLFSGALYREGSRIPIEDDHIPFLDRGIPAIDLINFEDLSTWHTSSDTLQNTSLESMRKASLLATGLVLELAKP